MVIVLSTTEKNEDNTDENTIINEDQPKVISHNEAITQLKL